MCACHVQEAAVRAEDAEEEEEEFRPPSPKYDERSFFFSAVHPWAVRTPSKTQRQRRTQTLRPTPESPVGLRTPARLLQQPAGPPRPESAASTRGGASAMNAIQRSGSTGSQPAQRQQRSSDHSAASQPQPAVSCACSAPASQKAMQLVLGHPICALWQSDNLSTDTSWDSRCRLLTPTTSGQRLQILQLHCRLPWVLQHCHERRQVPAPPP